MPVRPIMTFRQDERTASCLMKHAQEFTDRCDGTADGLVKRESLLNFALGNMRSASRAQWALSSIALAALVDGAESGRKAIESIIRPIELARCAGRTADSLSVHSGRRRGCCSSSETWLKFDAKE